MRVVSVANRKAMILRVKFKGKMTKKENNFLHEVQEVHSPFSQLRIGKENYEFSNSHFLHEVHVLPITIF
jgi:hypothetical protein